MSLTLIQARVTAHNPPRGMSVLLKGTGQMPSYPVIVLTDYVDAVRAKQKPLPQIGTWGIVLFSYEDPRNGIWLGSYAPSFIDAFTLTQASGAAATDPFIDYTGHYSGQWEMLDGLGNNTTQFADGSYVIAGSGTTLPTVYRHTVDSSNTQKRVAFPWTDRVPKPPNPFNYIFSHKTGTTVSVNVSGSVMVSGASGATLNMVFGGTTVTIDVSGKTTIALPASGMLDVTQGGGAPNDFLALVSKVLHVMNTHTHTIPSGGNTGAIATPVSTTDLNSVIVGITR